MISISLSYLAARHVLRRRQRNYMGMDFDVLDFGYGYTAIVDPGACADLDPEPWRADVSILLPEA